MGVLNIYDIMLAHNVPAYMATRKSSSSVITPTGSKTVTYNTGIANKRDKAHKHCIHNEKHKIS